MNLRDEGRYLSHCYLPGSLCVSSGYSFEVDGSNNKMRPTFVDSYNGLVYQPHQVENRAAGSDRKGEIHTAEATLTDNNQCIC